MKELDQNIKQSEKNSIEIVEQEKQQIEYQYIGNIIPHKGHTLYEINPKTLDIKEAEFKRNDTYVFGESLQEKKEVIINKGMVYISALNKNSAINRYNKGKGSSAISHQSEHKSIL